MAILVTLVYEWLNTEWSQNRNHASCWLHQNREPHGQEDVCQWVTWLGTVNDTLLQGTDSMRQCAFMADTV